MLTLLYLFLSNFPFHFHKQLPSRFSFFEQILFPFTLFLMFSFTFYTLLPTLPLHLVLINQNLLHNADLFTPQWFIYAGKWLSLDFFWDFSTWCHMWRATGVGPMHTPLSTEEVMLLGQWVRFSAQNVTHIFVFTVTVYTLAVTCICISLKLQEGLVVMEICIARVMELIQQHSALHCSTMVWAVVHALKSNVWMTHNGVFLAPSLSPPQISVPPVVGVTLPNTTSISLNLFSSTLLNIEPESFL